MSQELPMRPGIGYPADGNIELLRKLVWNTWYLATHGSGPGGGVTSIIAGSGISIDQPTGAVTITATGTGTPGGADGSLQYNNGGAFGGYPPGAGVVDFLQTPSSDNLRAALTDETGTGPAVFATSPTISAPNLTGTTTVATANATTLTATNFTFNSVSVTGPTGTGNMVLSNSPTLVTPALGTPSALVLTNATGLPASSLTAGILAANVTLGESAGQIVLDPTLSADGTYSGIIEAGTAGATLAFGDLVYFSVTDSRWELTDADADSTSGAVMIGICVQAAAGDGSATTILRWGKIRADANFPTLTVGAPAYVSTTPGDIQVAQPSGTDDVIRIVGYGITADVLLFQPSNDYMTHT